MGKFIVQMVHRYTGVIEDDCVDDMIFSSEKEAEAYAIECTNNFAEGAEVLSLSNPGDYEAEYEEYADCEYIVEEI